MPFYADGDDGFIQPKPQVPAARELHTEDWPGDGQGTQGHGAGTQEKTLIWLFKILSY